MGWRKRIEKCIENIGKEMSFQNTILSGMNFKIDSLEKRVKDLEKMAHVDEWYNNIEAAHSEKSGVYAITAGPFRGIDGEVYGIHQTSTTSNPRFLLCRLTGGFMEVLVEDYIPQVSGVFEPTGGIIDTPSYAYFLAPNSGNSNFLTLWRIDKSNPSSSPSAVEALGVASDGSKFLSVGICWDYDDTIYMSYCRWDGSSDGTINIRKYVISTGTESAVSTISNRGHIYGMGLDSISSPTYVYLSTKRYTTNTSYFQRITISGGAVSSIRSGSGIRYKTGYLGFCWDSIDKVLYYDPAGKSWDLSSYSGSRIHIRDTSDYPYKIILEYFLGPSYYAHGINLESNESTNGNTVSTSGSIGFSEVLSEERYVYAPAFMTSWDNVDYSNLPLYRYISAHTVFIGKRSSLEVI